MTEDATSKSEAKARAAFVEWKSEQPNSLATAFGRIEVTLKNNDGSIEVIQPFSFEEWRDQVHSLKRD